MTGMIEGFFGWLKFYDSGIFLGKKIWQAFFWWLDLSIGALGGFLQLF